MPLTIHAVTSTDAYNSYEIVWKSLKNYDDKVKMRILEEKITDDCETVKRTHTGADGTSRTSTYYPCGKEFEKNEYEWVAHAKINVISPDREILFEITDVLKPYSIKLEIGKTISSNSSSIALV